MTDVSIGLPVFNGQNLIEQAIESVLGQTYTDFELVISDNASTDRTEEICRAYASRDSRIKYFRNEENIGAAANFRRAFQHSSSEYFKWIGVDDYISDSYLEKTRQVLKERQDVVLCCSKVEIIDENSNTLRNYDESQELTDESPKRRFIKFLEHDSWVNSVYGLMRRETLAKTSIMGTFTGSDVVVMADMALYGKFHEVPDRLFFRRIHPDAYSYNCDAQKQQEFYSPGNRQRSLIFYRWRHLLEHFRSIRRAPIDTSEKRALLLYLLRTANWQKQELFSEIVSYPFGRHA